MIGKQVERKMWMNGLLALIPDAIIAWIAAAYTESGIFGFVLTMIGLQCLYFVSGVFPPSCSERHSSEDANQLMASVRIYGRPYS